MRVATASLRRIWIAFLVVGSLASLFAAHRRWQVEADNRRVAIAVEWPEVSLLAQNSGRTADSLLADFRAQGVRAVVLAEDTLVGLEQIGAVRPERVATADGRYATQVTVDDAATLQRIAAALTIRGITARANATAQDLAASGGTFFVVKPGPSMARSTLPSGTSGTALPQSGLLARLEYASLRTLGLGLPDDAVQIVQHANLAIVGRIGNFPTVTPARAMAALNALRGQGASVVIFNGDDVLGFKDMERDTALLLRDPKAIHPAREGEILLPASGLLYGSVEFSKQRGDEKLSAALHGDYVRVHAIQAAEVANMDEDEIEERFIKAVRERNMRLCYVRLLTQAGDDPIGANIEFLRRMTRGMARGGFLTGGGFGFGAPERFEETGVPRLLFALMGLGVVGGACWALSLLVPLPRRTHLVVFGLTLVICPLLATRGEMGQRLVALLAGIAFPTLACLLTFPCFAGEETPSAAPRGRGLTLQEVSDTDDRERPVRLGATINGHAKASAIRYALGGLIVASAVTALGILHVVGLLATRPFMLRANQFLGIKAQHAIPILIVAFVALLGAATRPKESWREFRQRVEARLRTLLESPLSIRLVVLGGIALMAMLLIVARTGNDAGVGVSGFELKARAVLDRFLVERPRTKEFLFGHPAFVLALAWAWRGRRTLALFAFVIGSIGQVSILNTFCHIHTPLIVSLWRDSIGLVLGGTIGVLLFVLLERVLPPPAGEASAMRE